jgi:hypothetical protein
MRHPLWLQLVCLVATIEIVAACGPLPTQPPPTSLLQTATVPGIEEAGPLPEYHLSLSLDSANRRLVGQQRVMIPNRTGVELGEIVFRLYPNLPYYGGRMGVGPVWVDGERSSSSLRADDTSLVIPLPRPLSPESSVAISMTFDIDIPQRTSGYVLFGHSQGIWSLPDAYPLLAVHDGSIGLGSRTQAEGFTAPQLTWHEDLAPAHGDAVIADAALYAVTLTLPPTLTLATTGSVMDETRTAAGQRVYHIVGGPLRQFAWLASPDYLVDETTAYGTTVRSYYLPGDESAGQAALNIAAAALRAYGDVYEPYPFPEMSVVEAPLRYYGMEYSSLNLIGLDLYREQRAELEDRVAHEIAHQWWYSQVGNDQVNTPWLDEGLAEYSMAVYYRQVFGQARANTLINQRWLVPYQAIVENGHDAIVNQPASSFGEEYEVIVYAKAALFFDALRQELGDDTYIAVLREYLSRYRWRIATPDDFLEVAESVSDRDLDELYNRWILSKTH